MRISTKQLSNLSTQQLIKLQDDVAKTQTQLATGKKILTPSDDALGANMILRFSQSITISERYIRIAGQAEGQLGLEEATLNSVTESLFSARDNIIRAGNGNYTSAERQAIAQDLEGIYNTVLGLANTQTASGEFLFSGFQTLNKPFTQDVTGAVVYNGDQGQREAKINDDITIPVSDSGFDVFEDVLSGNGIVRITNTSTNQGTGVIDPGNVDRSSFVSDTYTITFVTNNDGDLAYNVVGALSGQLIPALPADPTLDAPAFEEGSDITFNGITTNITGTPDAVAGDTFTVEPSARIGLFAILENALATLELPANNQAERANLQNNLNLALLELDQAMDNIDRVRASIGARLNAIDNEVLINEDVILSASTDLSRLRDVDYTEAATRLSLQITSLEAAQASFVRIQNLSLFNFL